MLVFHRLCNGGSWGSERDNTGFRHTSLHSPKPKTYLHGGFPKQGNPNIDPKIL